MSMQMVLVAGVIAVGTLILTGAIRRYALARALLDVPNERSSHSAPTPRGGGLAIVCSVLPGLLWATANGLVSAEFTTAAVGGGILTAGIGWVDDHRSVSAGLRLMVHFMAASWAVYWLGGLEAVRAGPMTLALGPGGAVLAIVFVVWLLNLYNFMDGIDGLAAAEAVTVSLGAAILAWISGAHHVAAVAVITAAASGGFLVWNWAPARIFLGDVGSGFLGYLLAVSALYSEASAGPPLLLWILLLSVFVVDATLTLIRRLVRGDPVFSAHRLHAYQRAVQSGYTHATVTVGVAVTNTLLLGLAILALIDARLLVIVVGVACVLLGWLYQQVERRHPM